LLPGLRQLRAPLAAGYLWLIAAWLAFAHAVPRPSEARPGPLKDLYDLGALVGVATVLAAATFVAYVVGVLSVQITAAALPRLGVFRRRRGALRSKGPIPPAERGNGALRVVLELRMAVATPSREGKRALREAILDELVERSKSDRLEKLLGSTRESFDISLDLEDPVVKRRLLDARIDVESYGEQLEQDLPLVPLRLLGEGKQREIYGEFDRLRAEAEFRASIALPLAVVICVLAWRTSLLWLLALAVPAILIVEALQNVTAAADVLAESIRARAANSPVLEELRNSDPRERKEEEWIARGAKMGYCTAMVQLAKMQEKHLDLSAAAEWFAKAAAKGDGDAMFWLFRYHYRRGEIPMAEAYFQEAVSAEQRDALQIKGLANDFKVEELTDIKAAYAGDPSAMFRLGEHFESRKRNEDAKDWYRKAHENGCASAREAMVRVLRSENKESAARDWERKGVTPSAEIEQDATPTS
jgi:hypothetical protein